MQMTVTEGEAADGWNINLWGDGMLVLSTPLWLDVTSAAWTDLRDLLQEYLEGNQEIDGGKGLRPLAAMFREFADLYEAEAENKGLPS